MGRRAHRVADGGRHKNMRLSAPTIYSRSPAASRASCRPDYLASGREPHRLQLNWAVVWLSELWNWLSAFPTVTSCCDTG